MFRKDVANAKAWSLEKVDTCARTQRDITLQAVKMLRPGGMMLYSTCTFAEEENEGTIAYLLENCPEMELTEIPWQEGYTHGRTGKNPELSKCVRIFPHKMEGEGHFLALLKKKGAHCSLHQKTARTSGKPSKEEEKILMEFLKDVSMDWSMEQIEVRAGQAYFVPEMLQLKGRIPFLRNGLYLGEIKKNRFEPSQSFAMALKGPAMMSGSGGKPGKNEKLSVHESLGRGEKPGKNEKLSVHENLGRGENPSSHEGLGEYVSYVNFDYSDERVRRYLCGETVEVDDLSPARSKGWQLVCVNGYPLGWGKLVNGTLKNKYHPGWRMQV